VGQETVVSSRRRRTEIPWLLPIAAGFVGLCILGGIGKMAGDIRTWQTGWQRPREHWEVDG
jgi:hypothetical protein